MENAVKIARKYTKRQAVVSFTRGFHGRTNMTMSMTSKVKPYKFGFGPFASEVYQAPFPYYYQKPAGMTNEQYDDFIISAFEDFFIAAVAPETVACVVMEPVQGEGGFIIPSKRFVQHVAAFVKHGIVFVADEIQTGFARTGTYFAIEHFEAVPDLITVSKSLAAGLPLSGVIGRAEMLDAAAPGNSGHICGKPSRMCGCACRPGYYRRRRAESAFRRDRPDHRASSARVEKEHACIGEVRRLGAMAAIEIVKDPDTREPDKAKAAAIAKTANENGLLLLKAGINGNIIRFLTPLVVTDEQLKEGLSIIEAAL